jgi:thiol-disulfide isomerase/thioredoxin
MVRAFGFTVLAALTLARAAVAAAPVESIGPPQLQAILAKERGNIVVLNVWATWCAPCLVEIPDLMRVEDKLADLKVKLIGIAVDDPGRSVAQIETLRKRHFPEFFTYARGETDSFELVGVVDPAWNEVVPTTYVLGRDGKVITRIQGKKSAEEFEAEIRKAQD